MDWHESVEVLLQKYADESQVRENLHRKAYYYYKKTQTWFQLPIIVLSAVSGSLQFLSKSYPEYESTIVTSTASISIFVSIISSVMTYLKPGESKKANEQAEIEWMNFYNHIRYQLSLARELRDEPEKFLSEVKQTYESLFKISPICNKKFISAVKKSVKKNADNDFKIPMYMNGFHSTSIWNDADD